MCVFLGLGFSFRQVSFFLELDLSSNELDGKNGSDTQNLRHSKSIFFVLSGSH